MVNTKKINKIMLLYQNNEQFNYFRIQSVKKNVIFCSWVYLYSRVSLQKWKNPKSVFNRK